MSQNPKRAALQSDNLSNGLPLSVTGWLLVTRLNHALAAAVPTNHPRRSCIMPPSRLKQPIPCPESWGIRLPVVLAPKWVRSMWTRGGASYPIAFSPTSPPQSPRMRLCRWSF
ncbi:hypothetical protein BDP55DRAFT_638048 [Colletotrichum godetiae]|uniref:Uncharacterized protein n=1 Tax=Colletotrichum godetiae TaxID=1209918 RepID=A0AAJ0AAQ2_9PEZI|nr:uncharacterized protein BDP55DRAFT_638048 [Colletotrichum godetiae]KAK1658181.1 hypothetical protein BDP55DRAFT_638048 [Colletotrichum godetiae]